VHVNKKPQPVKISRKTFLQRAGRAATGGFAGLAGLKNFAGLSGMITMTAGTTSTLSSCRRTGDRADSADPLVSSYPRFVAVAQREGRFLAWPANNGMWSWDHGREILVGFSEGDYVVQDGHNVGRNTESNLARSLDGGRSWTVEVPDNYVRFDGPKPKPSPGGFNFSDPRFAMRVAATGYRASDDTRGHFFVSTDKGKNWAGPYRFNGLNESPELRRLEITARTEYVVRDGSTCLVMMSARNPQLEFGRRLDKAFVAATTDGGRTFQFRSWIVPWTDDYRAVMPSVVEPCDGHFVAALRRRNPRDDAQWCWIDAYHSDDDGRSWQFLSRVAETGLHNGNPPALTLLRDGRLACCYANRSTEQILMRLSRDGGRNWGDELLLRENPLEYDIGYPQLVQNADGELVAMYYLADDANPVSYIEAAIWRPENDNTKN